MDRWLLCLVLLVLAQAAVAGGKSKQVRDPLAEGFRSVPPKDRMRLYWRIFGPAWTKPEIDRQLRQMKDAGLGGTVAYFMYPVEVDDPARGIHNQKWGSPEFLETFAGASFATNRRPISVRKPSQLGLVSPAPIPATPSPNGRRRRPPAKPQVEETG